MGAEVNGQMVHIDEKPKLISHHKKESTEEDIAAEIDKKQPA